MVSKLTQSKVWYKQKDSRENILRVLFIHGIEQSCSTDKVISMWHCWTYRIDTSGELCESFEYDFEFQRDSFVSCTYDDWVSWLVGVADT